MNALEINDLLEAAKPSIIQSLKDELTKSISWDAKAKVINAVNAHIEEWVKKEILPQVAEELVSQKDGIISIAKQIGPKIAEVMTEAMEAELRERLKEPYKRTKFFETLFGKGY